MTLFDVVADAMLLVDDVDHVVQANPVARDMLGYSQDEIIGLKVEALIPSRYHNHHRHQRISYAKNPESRPISSNENLCVLTHSGQELSVNMALHPMDIKGKSFTLMTLHTVDTLFRTEEALHISEDILRHAKNVAGLGVYDISIKYKTVHCDMRLYELWGISPNEEMTYEKFLAGIHPEDRQLRDAVLSQVSHPNGTGEYQVEYRVINPANTAAISKNEALIDYSERWILSIGKIFFSNGLPAQCVGVVQDITERKLHEKNLRGQRVDMESLALKQVAAQTVSAIAHELNQPLAAISAYSEVALHNIAAGKGDMAQLATAFERCVAQAQRAGKSLHELLEFLNKGELAPEPIDLNNIVREAITSAKNDVHDAFNLILNLENNLQPVLGNRIQVQKVLINLIRNAVEAMLSQGGATLTVSVKTYKAEDLNMAQVTVQDSGAGLNHEMANRIFEPFFTTKSKGIGMGLTISRALIEANGGQLWLDQEPSKKNNAGTSFHFTLPFAA